MASKLLKWLVVCLFCALPAESGRLYAQSAVRVTPPAVSPGRSGLAADSFGAIVYADLRDWKSSGCSFDVFRGKENIGLFDFLDRKKTAVFKIDGKLLFVAASRRKDETAYWSGTVIGNEVRLIKGKVDPNFRNDGGGQGGDGRLEWTGPKGRGSIPVRWEEGC